MKTKFGQTKKVTPENKSYQHASAALEDLGYEEEGIYEAKNPVSGKGIKRRIFKDKTKKLWAFYGMVNYNTTIYSITLKRFLGTTKDLN